jgi:CDP-diacylglycerol--glycerol-3-phosphate 3-phosphatidyltransferase
MGLDIVADIKKGWLPNAVTLIGLFFIPIIIHCHHHGYYGLTLLFFTLAWITDFFDGWLARKLCQTSQTGAFFDPLADKIFTITFLIYFWKNFSEFLSIPVIAIALSLTTLRLYKIYYGKKKEVVYNIMASISGKIKTSLEKSAICLLLLADFYVNLGCSAEFCQFYLQYAANFVLSVSIIFAAFSLHHQIHEIS